MENLNNNEKIFFKKQPYINQWKKIEIIQQHYVLLTVLEIQMLFELYMTDTMIQSEIRRRGPEKR